MFGSLSRFLQENRSSAMALSSRTSCFEKLAAKKNPTRIGHASTPVGVLRKSRRLRDRARWRLPFSSMAWIVVSATQFPRTYFGLIRFIVSDVALPSSAARQARYSPYLQMVMTDAPASSLHQWPVRCNWRLRKAPLRAKDGSERSRLTCASMIQVRFSFTRA